MVGFDAASVDAIATQAGARYFRFGCERFPHGSRIAAKEFSCETGAIRPATRPQAL